MEDRDHWIGNSTYRDNRHRLYREPLRTKEGVIQYYIHVFHVLLFADQCLLSRYPDWAHLLFVS